MRRTTYHYQRNSNAPSYQRLRAIDRPTATARLALIIRKPDGDKVFTVNSVRRCFGEFEHVKRHSHNTLNIMRVYPAYPTVVLYVVKAGSVPQAPDMYPLEVIDGEDTSPFMDTGEEDFSNAQDLESSSEQQADHMTNTWTSGSADGDVQAFSCFFALPKGTLPHGKVDPSAVTFKMFSLCKNRRAEHNSTYHFAGVPGVDIKRPAEFLRRFAAMVLRSLQSLKTELRDLATRVGGDEAEYVQITTLLQSDLDLLSANDVEPLVDKMIAYVQDLQSPSSTEQDHDSNGNKDLFSLSKYDIAVLPSYLQPRPGLLQGATVNHILMRVYDPTGLEQWVCPGCYRHLYHSYSTEDITGHIGDQGEYDGQLGRIIFRPHDSKELQKLCLLDVTKIGSVSELIVETEWDTSAEDLESIHALAVKFGFTRLTITSTTTSGSDSAVERPSQSSLPEESPGSTITTFDQISRRLIDGLTHLTVVLDEVLDFPTSLLDLLNVSPTKDVLVLRIMDPSSTYTVGIHDNSVQLLELEACLADISRMHSMAKFSCDLQSIAITDLDPELTDMGLFSRTNTIKTILRNNPDLSSLVLHWPTNDFPKAEAMMESIYVELSSEKARDFQFLTYTLIDNTDDQLSVKFLLPNSRLTKSIFANVTVRNRGCNFNTFLDTYGPFIQILNTNDQFESTCFDTLHDSIGRKNSSQLTNVTICLSALSMESARKLQSMLFLSKATLRQVVLVGSPLNDEAGMTVLSMLESLGLVQIVIFQDELDMETWIAQVQESVPSSSSLTVLDRIEDFRRIIPGYDETSLGWLRSRQVTQLHQISVLHRVKLDDENSSILISPGIPDESATRHKTEDASRLVHMREAQNAVVQRFEVPNIKASLKFFPTERRRNDNFFSVSVDMIKRAFPKYDHIKRAAPQDIVVPQESDPFRIRAYPGEILRVIYSEETQYQPGDTSEGGGDDDAMDDDDHGGYETDGDYEYGNQTDVVVDFMTGMMEM
ncbi:hypothetical protein BGZ89_009157 [Linnemannia elongata]|nr:hypothetical protein BGZ89_009157 [Linnemannia elongata]